MYGRTVCFAIEFRIVRLIFLEHIVNGGQEHPGNGDDRLLYVPAAFSMRGNGGGLQEIAWPEWRTKRTEQAGA